MDERLRKHWYVFLCVWVKGYLWWIWVIIDTPHPACCKSRLKWGLEGVVSYK